MRPAGSGAPAESMHRVVLCAGERTGLHGEEIAVNDDGSWEVVLAGRDPGHPNWLSTAGHQHGIVRIRWLIADREPLRPHTTSARISDLAR